MTSAGNLTQQNRSLFSPIISEWNFQYQITVVGTHGASAVAALIRGSDFQILADVDLSRFQIADNLLLRHMTQ